MAPTKLPLFLSLVFLTAPAALGLSDAHYRTLPPRRLTVRDSVNPAGLQSRQVTVPDLCNNGGSCVQCFGAGYVSCPSGSDVDCYNPNDSTTVCNYSSGSGSGISTPSIGSITRASLTSTRSSTRSPAATSSSSSSGTLGGNIDGTCEGEFGSDYTSCGSNGCYDPGSDEVCCADGSHCYIGQTCSSTPGKCCDTSDGDCSEDSFTMTVIAAAGGGNVRISATAATAGDSAVPATRSSANLFTQQSASRTTSSNPFGTSLRSGGDDTSYGSSGSSGSSQPQGQRAGGLAPAGAQPMIWAATFALGIVVGAAALIW